MLKDKIDKILNFEIVDKNSYEASNINLMISLIFNSREPFEKNLYDKRVKEKLIQIIRTEFNRNGLKGNFAFKIFSNFIKNPKSRLTIAKELYECIEPYIPFIDSSYVNLNSSIIYSVDDIKYYYNFIFKDYKCEEALLTFNRDSLINAIKVLKEKDADLLKRNIDLIISNGSVSIQEILHIINNEDSRVFHSFNNYISNINSKYSDFSRYLSNSNGVMYKFVDLTETAFCKYIYIILKILKEKGDIIELDFNSNVNVGTGYNDLYYLIKRINAKEDLENLRNGIYDFIKEFYDFRHSLNDINSIKVFKLLNTIITYNINAHNMILESLSNLYMSKAMYTLIYKDLSKIEFTTNSSEYYNNLDRYKFISSIMIIVMCKTENYNSDIFKNLRNITIRCIFSVDKGLYIKNYKGGGYIIKYDNNELPLYMTAYYKNFCNIIKDYLNDIFHYKNFSNHLEDYKFSLNEDNMLNLNENMLGFKYVIKNFFIKNYNDDNFRPRVFGFFKNFNCKELRLFISELLIYAQGIRGLTFKEKNSLVCAMIDSIEYYKYMNQNKISQDELNDIINNFMIENMIILLLNNTNDSICVSGKNINSYNEYTLANNNLCEEFNKTIKSLIFESNMDKVNISDNSYTLLVELREKLDLTKIILVLSKEDLSMMQLSTLISTTINVIDAVLYKHINLLSVNNYKYVTSKFFKLIGIYRELCYNLVNINKTDKTYFKGLDFNHLLDDSYVIDVAIVISDFIKKFSKIKTSEVDYSELIINNLKSLKIEYELSDYLFNNIEKIGWKNYFGIEPYSYLSDFRYELIYYDKVLESITRIINYIDASAIIRNILYKYITDNIDKGKTLSKILSNKLFVSSFNHLTIIDGYRVRNLIASYFNDENINDLSNQDLDKRFRKMISEQLMVMSDNLEEMLDLVNDKFLLDRYCHYVAGYIRYDMFPIKNNRSEKFTKFYKLRYIYEILADKHYELSNKNEVILEDKRQFLEFLDENIKSIKVDKDFIKSVNYEIFNGSRTKNSIVNMINNTHLNKYINQEIYYGINPYNIDFDKRYTYCNPFTFSIKLFRDEKVFEGYLILKNVKYLNISFKNKVLELNNDREFNKKFSHNSFEELLEYLLKEYYDNCIIDYNSIYNNFEFIITKEIK